MAKVVLPVITVVMTAGVGTAFGYLLNKTAPIFATVRK